jgi:hypothetical protein
MMNGSLVSDTSPSDTETGSRSAGFSCAAAGKASAVAARAAKVMDARARARRIFVMVDLPMRWTAEAMLPAFGPGPYCGQSQVAITSALTTVFFSVTAGLGCLKSERATNSTSS